MRRFMPGLAIAVLALCAATPAAAVPDNEIPAFTMSAAPPAAPHVAPAMKAGVDVVKLATSVTARWETLLATSSPWTMCVRGELRADTLQVTEDPVAAPCPFGSARSSSRPICEATSADLSAFAVSGERLRFTVCAPGKAFLLINRVLLEPATLRPRIDA